MINYILKPVRHQSFFKKYASKKYLKVCDARLVVFACIAKFFCVPQASVFVREWALQRWEEGSQVSLETELPALKELIREQRAMEEQMLAAQAAQEQGDSDGEVFQA